MSVHARKRARGRIAYEVTWRDQAGRQRCETFGTRREAETREREIRDLRERGRYDKIDAGTESLQEATERWWTDHVDVQVTSNTARVYATCLDRHLMPRLGTMPIRDIEPAHVIELQRSLRQDGVGAAMAQKVLVVLSGIMRHSQLLGRIERNPVHPVRIPQPRRKRAIRPLAPETIEGMRAFAVERGRLRQAALLSVMGFAGLRPGEAFALTWDCVGERSLIVEHGRADGELAETKTRRIRTVGLLGPVADDLRVWRQGAPDVADAELIFPRSDGTVFRDTDYRNWRKRHFTPGAIAAGVGTAHAIRAPPQLRQPARAGRLEPARDRRGDGQLSGGGSARLLAPVPRVRSWPPDRPGNDDPRGARSSDAGLASTRARVWGRLRSDAGWLHWSSFRIP